MKMISILFLTLFMVLLVSTVTATPNYKKNYNGKYKVISTTDIESIFNVEMKEIPVKVVTYINATYNITRTRIDTQICLTMEADTKQYITYIYDVKTHTYIIDKNITVSVPIQLPLYKEQSSKATTNLIRTKQDIFSPVSKSNPYHFCYQANPEVDFYLKFGNNSIIIVQDSDVVTDSVLHEVVAEANYTHLNISDQEPYNHLLFYYSFDFDDDGIFPTVLSTVHDLTNNGNDGEINGTIIDSGGFRRVFNSSDSVATYNYVRVPDSGDTNFNADENFTFSLWFYERSSSGTVRSIINKRGNSGYMLVTDIGGGTWLYRIDEGGSNVDQSVSPPSRDTWHHVVFGRNATHMFIYIDNVHVGSKTHNQADLTDATVDLYIGANTIGGETPAGMIDEVMLFNVSLTKSEINDIWLNQSARFKTEGTQILNNQTYLNISMNGNNSINITLNYQNLKNSNISVNLSYYNTSNQWYTSDVKNITRIPMWFNVSGTTTNISLTIEFYAGNTSHPFYTPYLNGSIILETWNFSVTAAPAGDTCDCSSIQAGTTIDCTENCDIEACDASNQHIILDGAGNIILVGDVTNHRNITIMGGCKVTSQGGFSFK